MPDQGSEPYQPPSRRRFFECLVNGIGAAIAVILAVPLGGLYVLPALRKPKVVWKKCGSADAFPVGDITFVALQPLERRQWPENWGTEAAWVFRKSADRFIVYNLHCTHVGCPVNWSPPAKRFFCPCHGGVFDQDGRVVAGPPPRPLDRYDVKVENGSLYAGPVYRVNNRLEREA
jgi:menaquinol-cytochrome c reductase iron-sulfur subunit